MKIDIAPNLDQIRFFAESALHAFDFQSPEDARASVVADMLALLGYLEAFDDSMGIAVAGIRKIESGVRIEVSTREGETFDVGHSYALARLVTRQPSDLKMAQERIVKHIGTQNHSDATEPERNLSPPLDSRA
jgi:hypothetical protein